MTRILGIDETGRGPIIGSMFIVGVLATEETESNFKELGVKDSKLLTHKKRCLLEGKIKDLALKVKIIQVKPEEIDNAVDGGSINLNWLEAHKQAEIINELKPDKVIIDCPSPNCKKYTDYLKALLNDKSIELVVEHRAEKYMCVAAASVIAKCEREKEVAELKKKYGDFGSLPFEERVWVMSDNFLTQKKIGNVVENEATNKLSIFSLDRRNLEVGSRRITYGFRHGKMDIYTIYFDTGLEAELSPNHPLFVISSNLDLIPKALYEIEAGDYIAFVAPENRNFIESLDVFALLKSQSTKNHPLFFKSDKIRALIKRGRIKLLSLARDQGYKITSLRGWLKPSMLPLHLLREFDLPKDFLFSGKITSWKGNSLPSKMILTKDLCWFFGLYLAEGCLIGDYAVDMSNRDKSIRKKIMQTGKRYGFGCCITRDSIRIHSILLNRLIRALCLGSNAREKRLSPIFYNLSRNKIKLLLQGIYDGDGYGGDNPMEVEVCSKELRDGIVNLELLMGNICSLRKRENRGSFIARRLSKSTNSLSKDNIPSIIGSYIRLLRLKKSFGLREFERKCNISRRVLSCIETQKVGVVSKNTLRKINCLLKDKQLSKLINSKLFWLKVIKIVHKGLKEVVYDLEVRPSRFQNFLCSNGLILHNSGYMSDPYCKKFFKENFDKHPEIFRKSWTPYKNEVNGKKQKKIDEF